MATSVTGAGITFPDSTTQATATPLNPVSMVTVYGANGYGSTNTVIRRFSTVGTNTGSSITYADSATLGASFTINISGVYAISYTDMIPSNVTSYVAGVSLNSTQLTTIIYNITPANILCYGYAGASTNEGGGNAWVGYIASGGVVRPHLAQASLANTSASATFTITRIL
jgi:hypothetical protein